VDSSLQTLVLLEIEAAGICVLDAAVLLRLLPLSLHSQVAGRE
jgi:hypothetical protein